MHEKGGLGLYKNREISSLIKTAITILMLSLIPVISYSAEVTSAVPVNESVQQQETRDSEKKNASSDEFCVIEKLSYFVNWVEKAIKRIEEEHFSSKSNDSIEEIVSVPVVPVAPVAVIEEEPNIILDLTIPDMKYEGTMGVDKGQKLNFPDMFSAQSKKPYIKEEGGASFGGRLLMDDAELENMEKYRFNEVREAVRGAEVSLEFKTN